MGGARSNFEFFFAKKKPIFLAYHRKKMGNEVLAYFVSLPL